MYRPGGYTRRNTTDDQGFQHLYVSRQHSLRTDWIKTNVHEKIHTIIKMWVENLIRSGYDSWGTAALAQATPDSCNCLKPLSFYIQRTSRGVIRDSQVREGVGGQRGRGQQRRTGRALRAGVHRGAVVDQVGQREPGDPLGEAKMGTQAPTRAPTTKTGTKATTRATTK